MNKKLDIVYQQLIKTAIRKQQNSDDGLWMAQKLDIMFEILHNLTHLDQSETLITVMSSSFYFKGFSLGHIIITTIIKYWTWILRCSAIPVAVSGHCSKCAITMWREEKNNGQRKKRRSRPQGTNYQAEDWSLVFVKCNHTIIFKWFYSFT